MHSKSNRICPACGGPKHRSASQCWDCRWKPRPIIDNGDGTATVPLTQGFVAVIDAVDIPIVNDRNWAIARIGGNVYARNRNTEWHISMQNVILPPPPGMRTDHIDGDGLNNRRSNLRHVTCAQNVANQPKRQRPKSGYRGVRAAHWHSGFVAYLKHMGQRFHLGTYPTPEEAAHAYDAKAREIWGEAATLNFPDNHH